MRTYVTLLLLAFGLSSFAGIASAQDFQERRINLTPFVGWTLFDKELKSPPGPTFEHGPYFGGRASVRVMTPLWLDLAGGYTATTGSEDGSWTQLSANLMLVSSEPRAIAPFVSLGGGVSKFVPRRSADQQDGTFDAAVGAKVKLTDALGLRLEARNVLFVPRRHFEKSHIDNIVLGAGLVFALGARDVDTDGDGVNDKRDRCPGTARGCVVNAEGCPIDTDGDGICDGVDKCPDTRKGCTVDARGCPSDTDGDGVCDGIDQCIDTPHGTAVDSVGCAPATMGALAPDSMDTSVPVFANVRFETAQSDILPEFRPSLDEVGATLVRRPALRFDIGGHCDSRGTDAYNMALGQRRASAVQGYLMEHFPQLGAAQLVTTTYGESTSALPNTSAANMAQNRRVVFTMLNKDVALQVQP